MFLGRTNTSRTKGRRWLYTGDFRLAEDSSCDAFEPIKTDVLVMESTFGLPIFRWRNELEVFKEIFDMWENCKQTKMNLVLYCYSLENLKESCTV